ncbi:transcriptional regulator MntR [Capillibacterium thermochitinicola]|nr:transcriptional regulator MntR [Capillibacterium thermochitinicola]
MVLTESMEDYLEMFYRIVAQQGYIRPIDLSNAIKVKPSSVTRMIKKLDEAGFIKYEKYRNIALTEKGMVYGRFLVWRDEKLKEFFRLSPENVKVEEQVEGVEHYITPETMKFIHKLILYFSADPGRVRELEKVECPPDDPNREDLKYLRAWLFRHSG